MRSRYSVGISFGLFLVAAFLLFPAGAQPPAGHEMSIMTGKGELLQFGQDVLRVVVAEPKIADAIVVSPREVMVNAKGPGKTTLVIWESGVEAARYNISVTPDNSEF